jgi:hypothetical protein
VRIVRNNPEMLRGSFPAGLGESKRIAGPRQSFAEFGNDLVSGRMWRA